MFIFSVFFSFPTNYAFTLFCYSSTCLLAVTTMFFFYCLFLSFFVSQWKTLFRFFFFPFPGVWISLMQQAQYKHTESYSIETTTILHLKTFSITSSFRLILSLRWCICVTLCSILFNFNFWYMLLLYKHAPKQNPFSTWNYYYITTRICHMMSFIMTYCCFMKKTKIK